MRQWLKRKSFTLVVGILTILLLILLVGGMDALEFKQGTPFNFTDNEDEIGLSISIDPPNWAPVAIVILVIFIIITIFILIIATPKQRRRILFMLLAMIIVLLGVMWWISRDGSGEVSYQPTVTMTRRINDNSDPTLSMATSVPPIVYTPPSISPWISIGITFIILLVFSGLAWFFFRRRWRDDIPLDVLVGIAEGTIVDLESGRDYGDSVIDCYAKMIEAVSKQRGISRSGNLTPKEFMTVLERAQLPPEPVRRLTRLFSRVRYGGKTATPKEVKEAIDCLNEIVSSIREVQ